MGDPDLVWSPVSESTDKDLASRLRGFGPVGFAAILIILSGNLIVVPLSQVLVAVWARLSRTPWHELGLKRPRNWLGVIAIGLLFGVSFKLLMKAIVLPLFGADPINPAFQHLVGNTAALPMMLFAVIVIAGFGEELLFRGYLFERLGALLGERAPATVFAVVFTALFFGFAHYLEQSWYGVLQGTIVGLVYGTIYAITRRIWMLVIAHAAFDVTAVMIIYWNLEATVARLILK